MRASRVVVMVAALVLLTSGCWVEVGQSPGRGGFNPFESQVTAATVSQLGVAWQHQLTGPVSEPLINPSGPTAYVASGGALTAYDLASGSSPWSNTTMPAAFDPMLIGAQLNIVRQGSTGCELDRLDATTGNLATTTPFGQSIGTPSNLCLFPTPLGTDTVVIPWTQAVLSGHSASCPTNNTETIYEGLTSIGHFEQESVASTVCYFGSPPFPPLNIGTPMQAGNLLVMPAGDTLDSVVALNNSTGNTVWSAFGGGSTVNGPVISLPNGDVAYTTSNGQLRVHNGTTGAFKWSAQLDTTLTLPPATTGSTIFVATPGGVLDALPVGGCNAATCSPVWHGLTNAASVRPSIGGNVVYVGSNDGTVTAFPANGCNASTCASLWSGATGSKITGAPAIGQGTVLVGSANGTVTAFRLQPQA